MINQQKSYKYFYKKITEMIDPQRSCKYFYKKFTENYKNKNIFYRKFTE